MKTLVPAWLVHLAATGLTAFAAPASISTSPDLTGGIPGAADVVLEWNAALTSHFEEHAHTTTPHIQARVYSLAHLAMRDSVVASLQDVRHDAHEAVAKAAASEAAKAILLALCPAGVNRFEALHSRRVTAIMNDGAAAHARQVGQRIASSILNTRAGDGWPVALTRSHSGNGSGATPRGRVEKPVPFVLKRPYQFAPALPFFEHDNGVVIPNGRLRDSELIGLPTDVKVSEEVVALWRADPIATWNRVAQSLALRQPQELPVRARRFAALNMALADALLAATYWSDAYRQGRGNVSILGVLNSQLGALRADESLPDPSSLAQVIRVLTGFPATPAVLAGAAETILRSTLEDGALIELRSLARQCAWASLVNGESTFEACVAGYELGSRIAGEVLKRDRG